MSADPNSFLLSYYSTLCAFVSRLKSGIYKRRGRPNPKTFLRKPKFKIEFPKVKNVYNYKNYKFSKYNNKDGGIKRQRKHV